MTTANTHRSDRLRRGRPAATAATCAKPSRRPSPSPGIASNRSCSFPPAGPQARTSAPSSGLGAQRSRLRPSDRRGQCGARARTPRRQRLQRAVNHRFDGPAMRARDDVRRDALSKRSMTMKGWPRSCRSRARSYQRMVQRWAKHLSRWAQPHVGTDDDGWRAVGRHHLHTGRRPRPPHFLGQ